MDDLKIAPLVSVYHRLLANVSLSFKRYLYPQIQWNVRMLGIKGERGVGKTTLILQHIRETFKNPDDALYVSMDNLWFSSHSPIELADYLYAHGIMYLFMDEIHRYPGWSQLLKNLYDNTRILTLSIQVPQSLKLTDRASICPEGRCFIL